MVAAGRALLGGDLRLAFRRSFSLLRCFPFFDKTAHPFDIAFRLLATGFRHGVIGPAAERAAATRAGAVGNLDAAIGQPAFVDVGRGGGGQSSQSEKQGDAVVGVG